MPDSAPSISVIIPTFNRPTLVPLAINSVLAQSQPATEIIVVDDGSAQDMREVLAPFGNRIRVIRQANGGLSAARNTGIKAATTDWVAFLDDDDEYGPNRLAHAVESIRRHPSAALHLTNTAIVSEAAPDIDLFRVRGMKTDEWMEITRPLPWVLRGCFFAQSMVVRRSVLHDIGLFRSTFYEDMDLYVRLVPRAPWIIDGKPDLRLIRRGNTSAMSDDWRSKPLKRCEALVRIHREALTVAGSEMKEIKAVQTGLATYLFELGAAHNASGDSSGGRKCFSEAARTFPALHSRLKARAAAIGGRPIIILLQAIARRRKGIVR
jgi:glycosyltransferase involved in cell wall biosynthesis